MTLPVSQKNGSFGHKNPGRDSSGRTPEQDPAEEEAAAKAALNEEVIKRFKAMIEGVADELMQGKPGDRDAARADAIALLMSAGTQLAVASPPAPDVSGVVVEMLQAEQQMREGKRENDPEKASGPEQIFTFLRV